MLRIEIVTAAWLAVNTSARLLLKINIIFSKIYGTMPGSSEPILGLFVLIRKQLLSHSEKNGTLEKDKGEITGFSSLKFDNIFNLINSWKVDWIIGLYHVYITNL